MDNLGRVSQAEYHAALDNRDKREAEHRKRIADLEDALSAERLRVIEECAKVIENWPTWDLWRGEGAAALRALGRGDAPADDVAWGIIEWMRDGECGDGGGCLSDGCRCREGCGCADKISDALSAERARLTEMCAKWHDAQARGYSVGTAEERLHRRSAAALRALGQQDTGGADHE